MTYNNENGPIYSMLNGKPPGTVACIYTRRCNNGVPQDWEYFYPEGTNGIDAGYYSSITGGTIDNDPAEFCTRIAGGTVYNGAMVNGYPDVCQVCSSATPTEGSVGYCWALWENNKEYGIFEGGYDAYLGDHNTPSLQACLDYAQPDQRWGVMYSTYEYCTHCITYRPDRDSFWDCSFEWESS